MKLLTILVSQYNSGVWIENRLNNIFASTVIKQSEVICLNANSPDERDTTVPKRFNVKIINTPHINVYSAWNVMIRASDSKYITIANTDDIVSPVCYERLIQYMSTHDVAYPSWYSTKTPNQHWSKLHDTDITKPGNYTGDLGRGLVGHFPLWSRKLHQKIGLFNESYKALGDAEFWARCYYQAKAKFKWCTKPLGCYLWREGNNLWDREINQNEWDMYHSTVAKIRSQS